MDIVQAKGAWDSITTRTRGLITDSKGNIKAHSFNKFHNIEQNLHNPTNEFTVYEKVDGSLIILFWDEDEWIITSRGSFTSNQAKYAKKLIDTQYDASGLNKDYAYSFEIIYPENRIVVDYKDRRELIFLAAFAKDGTEVDVLDSIKNMGTPIVKQYDFRDYTTIKSLDWENCEGFVVRFSNGDRTKIKFNNYLDLHGKITGLNAQTVWTKLASGISLETFLEDIPDEFHKWVQDKWSYFTKEFESKKNSIIEEYNTIIEKCDKSNRADFAKYASKSAFKKQLFLLLDNKNISISLMDAIKPVDGLLDIPYNGAN
jgi:RNA ligase